MADTDHSRYRTRIHRRLALKQKLIGHLRDARELVKLATASGIALSFSRAALAESLAFDARETLPGNHNWNPAATGAGRINGPAKVTGSKLYASDFRAADTSRLATEYVARFIDPSD